MAVSARNPRREYESQSSTQKPTSPGHRQPLTAFETHNGRSTFAAGTALHAPFLPLPPSSTLSRSDFAKRGLSAALKKGPRLVVLRLLRLWPLLLLTPDQRARAAD